MMSHQLNRPIIIPHPKRLLLHEGRDLLPQCGNIALIELEMSEKVTTLTRQLQDEILTSTGARWNVTRGRGWSADICMTVSDRIRGEGYRLHIGRHDDSGPWITLTGANTIGLRYGVQTLRQIIRQYGLFVPRLEITDSPELETRAFSVDVSRGRVLSLSTLKQLVDVLCLYKYNQLQLYTEHTIKFDDMSESWTGHDPLDSNEILLLDDYCCERGIELVPTLATFGHLYDILRTRQFRAFSELPKQADRNFSFIEKMLHHTINPSNPLALKFMLKRIDEYTALFRSAQCNVCGDETFDLGKSASIQGIPEKSIPHLYATYMQVICRHVMSLGKRPIVYADIALRHPELLSALPHETILANWDYLPNPNIKNIDTISASGHTQLVCAGTQTWNRLLPNIDDAWANITAMCKGAHTYHAQGAIITDWGDYGHINDPSSSLIALVYGSQCSWNPDSPGSQATINHESSQLLFGDRTGAMVSVIGKAARLQTLSWADLVQFMELDEGGEANPDVQFVLQQPRNETLHMARARFLDNRRAGINKTEDNNIALTTCEEECAAIAPDSISSTFTSLYALLGMLMNGQRLFNRIGTFLLDSFDTTPQRTKNDSHYFLANELEKWESQYEARWRSLGPESDLRRIRRVVTYYTSLLRRSPSSTA